VEYNTVQESEELSEQSYVNVDQCAKTEQNLTEGRDRHGVANKLLHINWYSS